MERACLSPLLKREIIEVLRDAKNAQQAKHTQAHVRIRDPRFCRIWLGLAVQAIFIRRSGRRFPHTAGQASF